MSDPQQNQQQQHPKQKKKLKEIPIIDLEIAKKVLTPLEFEIYKLLLKQKEPS